MAKKMFNKQVSEPVAEVVVEPAVEQSLDLKESLELIKGFELILNSIEAILKDGKVDWSDAVVAIDVLKQYQVFVDAAKEIDMIPAELKDLDSVEMLQFATAVFPFVKKIKEIVLLAKAL